MDPRFEAVLRRRRDSFNDLFRQARQYSLQLEPTAVYRFLSDTLDPIVAAVAPLLPEAELDELALKLTVLALDLLGKHLLEAGPFVLIADAWRRLFSAHPQLLAESPRRAVAALSNALIQLCLHPGARPESWVDRYETLGGDCRQLDDWLALGQVLGWQAGLAHYRRSALEQLGRLPENLQSRLCEGRPLGDWQASPWCGAPGSGLRVVHRSGGFAGWGGRLIEPPTLAWDGDALLVADSRGCWYLFADRYGESWLRYGPTLPLAPGQPSPWEIDPAGRVRYGEASASLTALAGWRQAAGSAHTLAVAMPDSFVIQLLSP